MTDPIEPFPTLAALRRRLARLFLSLLLAAVPGTAAVQAQAPEQDEESPRKESPWVLSIEGGSGYTHYSGDREDGNGQFVRLGWAKPQEFDLRLDAGRQERFGETTAGVGASFTRHFENKTSVNVGVGSSTGELAPEFSAGLSVSHPFFDIIWTAGIGRDEWMTGARTDRLSVGVQRWFPHWIVAGSVKYENLQPGDTNSVSGSVGLTYYVWKQAYLSLAYDFGEVSFTLLGQESALVDYTARGLKLGYSRWFRSSRGFSVRIDWGRPPEATGLTVSWFHEW